MLTFKTLGLMESHISKDIKPDYTLTTLQVYAAFVKTIFSVEFSTNILRQGNALNDENWPSWVFNLMRPRVAHRLKEYTACGYHSNARISWSSRLLTAPCVKVDEVDGLSCRFWDEAGTELNPPEPPVEGKSRCTKKIYKSLEAIKEALWRTLVGDKCEDGKILLDIPWWDTKEPIETKKNKKIWKALDKNGWTPEVLLGRHETFTNFRIDNAKFNIFGRNFQDYFLTMNQCQDFPKAVTALEQEWQMSYGRR